MRLKKVCRFCVGAGVFVYGGYIEPFLHIQDSCFPFYHPILRKGIVTQFVKLCQKTQNKSGNIASDPAEGFSADAHIRGKVGERDTLKVFWMVL